MAYEYVIGKVSRLFPHNTGCAIKLDTYGDREFALEKSHDNYNSIYSLLLAAAVNRYTVHLRLESYSEPDPPSDIVLYIVVDW